MHHRTRLLLIMTASILFSLGLLSLRIVYTRSPIYAFLVWNLLLAAMPLGISTLLTRVKLLQRSSLTFAGLVGLWLLFFPNAPYILTDLLHLNASRGAPLWFDLILIASFSWSGLILGFLSLSDLQDVLRRRHGNTVSIVFAGAALTSAAFGIYLGRFLRWNSWDLMTRPELLLRDVADRVLNPLSHPTAVAVTVLLSVLLTLWYLAFRVVTAGGAAAEGKRGAAAAGADLRTGAVQAG